MRLRVVYLALVALVVLAVALGRLELAIMIGALKALLVGLEFMELRHAARVHALAFVALVLGIAGAILIVA